MTVEDGRVPAGYRPDAAETTAQERERAERRLRAAEPEQPAEAQPDRVTIDAGRMARAWRRRWEAGEAERASLLEQMTMLEAGVEQLAEDAESARGRVAELEAELAAARVLVADRDNEIETLRGSAAAG